MRGRLEKFKSSVKMSKVPWFGRSFRHKDDPGLMETRVTHETHAGQPTWTPEGKRLVFQKSVALQSPFELVSVAAIQARNK